MIRRIMLVLALAVLVTACSSTPDSSATSTTDGMTTETNRGAMNKDDVIFDNNGQTGATAGAGSQEDLVANAGDRVFFANDSSDVAVDGRAVLEKQAQWLKTYANVSITVEGHCDERGTREYNMALGERRANAVKNYLMSLGVDGSRINTISYGKERPAVMGNDESAWSQNRRGVTVVN